jgi:hypothetical protein
MGTLTPGASYIYERNGGEVYAREVGKKERKLIGYQHDMENKLDPRTNDGRPLHDHIMESKLWGNILRAAKKDPALQEALERVKVTYYLTKDYEERYGNRKT